MPKDRSWVLLDDHRLDAFQNGCVEFLDFALKKAAIDDKIRCPCRDCKCRKVGDREFVHKHLLWRGWDKSYGQGQWIMHLESDEEYQRCGDPVCEEMKENESNNPRMAISADHDLSSINEWTNKHLKRIVKNATLSTKCTESLEESVASTANGGAIKKQLGVENPKPCEILEAREREYENYLNGGGCESPANAIIVCQKVLGKSKKRKFKRSNTKKLAIISRKNSDQDDRIRSLKEQMQRLDEKIARLESTITELRSTVKYLTENLEKQGFVLPNIPLAGMNKEDGK
ncbi:PREDICTED: uncharacterized protein LOC105965612 [Erythranthe guttata]|uniref:uncharacterized protein LOC105965612 n=1 Tax=Erythranthe guttata TaxID=4155 RepID=UPI00064DC2D1|nr:PREDICTED: uncharacterized protein LOC105965612 [Erythranthe guttata]|eukprot:XP_012845634.1 PREDICTED: uncharacterized protein LOC105965612 [Erythranthe guttata]